MEAQLQKLFNDLETQRFQLLAYVSTIDSAKLNLIPAAGKWSINQIIYHLILAEELSYKSIKAKVLTDTNFEKIGFKHQLRVLLLRLFLRSSKKFKAPLAVSDLPDNLILSELSIKWNQSRQNLKELLESLPENLRNKSIFKHPVAGKLSIYGGLNFFHEHVRRHHNQILKIASAQ